MEGFPFFTRSVGYYFSLYIKAAPWHPLLYCFVRVNHPWCEGAEQWVRSWHTAHFYLHVSATFESGSTPGIKPGMKPSSYR
jgi:hypothetical protein